MNQANQRLKKVKQYSDAGNAYYEQARYGQALHEFQQALPYADQAEDRAVLKANIEDIQVLLDTEPPDEEEKPFSFLLPFLFDILFFLITVIILFGVGYTLVKITAKSPHIVNGPLEFGWKRSNGDSHFRGPITIDPGG